MLQNTYKLSTVGVTSININTLSERRRFCFPTSYHRGGLD